MEFSLWKTERENKLNHPTELYGWIRRQKRSPTAAQSLHHFLDKGGLRVTVPLPTGLLTAHTRVTGTSHASRKVSIGVLELGLCGCRRGVDIQVSALAFGRHT